MNRYSPRGLVAALIVSSFAFVFGGRDLAAASQGPDLAAKVKQTLTTYCYPCHGQNGRSEGGMSYVVDLESLVDQKQIVPGKPDESSMFERIVNAEMPPKKNKRVAGRPSDREIADVKAWIEAGAPSGVVAKARRVFISEADIVKFILADLDKVNPERNRRNIRYFTITHLANAGMSDDELLSYRHGLSKLINSLSWGGRVVKPEPIDPSETIFRIDLRHFQWSPKVWEAILAIYPYGVIHADETSRKIYAATDCKMPYVRADWFVFEASKPPLYHTVLQIPDTDRELETRLGVDVAANIQDEQVDRAAFRKSGVSDNNRMIERHDLGIRGAYWKSYDFAGNVGRQQVLNNPLGPGNGPNTFQHDGGEIIFSLPNGLQAYMLVDSKAGGKRIDKGPTNIVRHPEGLGDRSVVNGISCMDCHKFGLMTKADEVRATAVAGLFANKDVTDSILALYPPKAKFDALMKQDMDRFAKAVGDTGAPFTDTEPVFALARRFQKELTPKLAASEAGLPVEDFLRRVRANPQLLDHLRLLLVQGGTVERDTYKAVFPQIIAELRLGTYLAMDNVPPVPPVPKPVPIDKLITNTIGMKLTLIPAGSFEMGSPESDKDAFGDEKPQHTARISKPFYMGVYEVTQQEYEAVVGSNPSYFSAKGEGKAKVGNIDTRKLPVENVSWLDAVAFCNALSVKEGLPRFYTISGGKVSVADWNGKGYRLPTEAEWEYAARAGKQTRYSFGDNPGSLGEFAWFDDNSNGRTHPVGEKTANGFGLYDMHGNVFEWCWDGHAAFGVAAVVDPRGPDEAAYRVNRGGGWGGWGGSGRRCRSANRDRYAPGNRISDLGFRVARVQ